MADSESKFPIVGEIVKILNSICGDIELANKWSGLYFEEFKNSLLFRQGLVNTGIELPAIGVYGIESGDFVNNTLSLKNNSARIELIHVLMGPDDSTFNCLFDIGFTLDGASIVAQVISDITQITSYINYRNSIYAIEPISREEAQLKYFPNKIKPSNNF